MELMRFFTSFSPNHTKSFFSILINHFSHQKNKKKALAKIHYFQDCFHTLQSPKTSVDISPHNVGFNYKIKRVEIRNFRKEVQEEITL